MKSAVINEKLIKSHLEIIFMVFIVTFPLTFLLIVSGGSIQNEQQRNERQHFEIHFALFQNAIFNLNFAYVSQIHSTGSNESSILTKSKFYLVAKTNPRCGTRCAELLFVTSSRNETGKELQTLRESTRPGERVHIMLQVKCNMRKLHFANFERQKSDED